MKYGIALLGLVLALPAAAQTVTLDEGTFRVLVDGREVGVENFSIRQNGTGAEAVIIAQARVGRASPADLAASVQFTGATEFRPVAFEVEVRGTDARRISAALNRSRASARTVSSSGETMKEFLVSDGVVILDDGVAHLYYFVGRRLAAGSSRVPVILPRESQQVVATVSAAGDGNVTVGGASVRARRINIELRGDARVLYVDAEGRVLRVEIPGKNTVFQRNALP